MTVDDVVTAAAREHGDTLCLSDYSGNIDPGPGECLPRPTSVAVGGASDPSNESAMAHRRSGQSSPSGRSGFCISVPRSPGGIHLTPRQWPGHFTLPLLDVACVRLIFGVRVSRNKQVGQGSAFDLWTCVCSEWILSDTIEWPSRCRFNWTSVCRAFQIILWQCLDTEMAAGGDRPAGLVSTLRWRTVVSYYSGRSGFCISVPRSPGGIHLTPRQWPGHFTLPLLDVALLISGGLC